MKTILIIEDDQMLIEMYKDKFGMDGFSIITAMNGKDGLEIALKQHPDVILLDIAMPKMDGMTLMKQIREDSWGKAVPIIILTNLNIDGELLNKIIKYKPVYSLLKANTVPEDVLAKIREVLGNAK